VNKLPNKGNTADRCAPADFFVGRINYTVNNMKKEKTQEQQLDELEKFVNQTDNYILFEIGVGLQYEYAPPNIQYSAPYIEMGKRLWHSLRYEIYLLLCDPKKKIPQKWVKELLDGEVRNLGLAIISAIASAYEVSVGIAVPVAAMVIKKKIPLFCKSTIKKPRKSVHSILEDQKVIMKPVKNTKKKK